LPVARRYKGEPREVALLQAARSVSFLPLRLVFGKFSF
jgi:hypothetical protein